MRRLAFSGAGVLILAVAANPAPAQLFENLRAFRDRLDAGDPEIPALFNEGPKGVAAGDLDENGFPDIAASNLDGTVSVHLNDAEGGFLPPIHLHTGMKTLRGIILEDFTGDGLLDIATAAPSDGKLVILLNSGGGKFGEPRLVDAWKGARNLEAGHFDDLFWFRTVVFTGTATSSRLYFYLEGVGEALVDNVSVTHVDDPSTEMIRGGDFDAGADGWGFSGNHEISHWSPAGGVDGTGCLDVVATGQGTSGENSVNCYTTPDLVPGESYRVHFQFQPLRGSTTLVCRLSGSHSPSTGLFRRVSAGAPGIALAGPGVGLRQYSAGGGGYSDRGFFEPMMKWWDLDAPPECHDSSAPRECRFPRPVYSLRYVAWPEGLWVTHSVSDRVRELIGGYRDIPDLDGVYYLDVGPLTNPADTGILDLVTAHRNLGTVEVRRNIRSGAELHQRIHIAGGPRAVKIVDFDADGWNDLAVVVRNFDQVLTYRNEDGLLVLAHETPVGRSPRDLAVADFDGDDWPDIAVINRISSDMNVLNGHPKEVGFSALDQYYLVDGEVVAVEVHDMNGDSRDDVVQLHRASGDLSIRLSGADGLLLPPVFYPTGRVPTALALVEVDGDDIPDAVTANLGIAGIENGSISVRPGDGAGGFGPEIRSPLSDLPAELQALDGRLLLSSLAMGDFDGDGKVDAAAGFLGSRLGFFKGTGAGSFVFAGRLHHFPYGRATAAGDFDRDGDTDLAGASCVGDVAIVKNNLAESAVDLLTAASLDVEYYSSGAHGSGTTVLKALDTNGDGDLDLVLGSGKGVWLFEGIEDAGFQPPPDMLPGTDFSVWSVASGHFDGDGRIDLAVGSRHAAILTVLTRSSAGDFIVALTTDVPAGKVLAPGDLDGDGHADLVGSGDVLWTALSSRRAQVSPPPVQEGSREGIPEVVINEIIAFTPRKSPDWIELYNNTGKSIDLAGWSLVVEVPGEEPFTHTFPQDSAELLSGGGAVVYFSDPVISPDDVAYDLPREGGKLVLVTPRGEVADEVEYPEQFKDVAYARYGDGLPAFVFNPYPSPERSNVFRSTVEPILGLERLEDTIASGGGPLRFWARGRDDMAIVSVSLFYRRLDVEDDDFRRIFLHDDGMQDDGEMQDGLFAGVTDEALPAGAEMLFYLEVVDLNDNLVRVPRRESSAVADGSGEGFKITLESDLPDLEISEFVARNSDGLEDENDRHPDWVEIRNCSGDPVSLAGVFLGENYPATSAGDWFAFPPDRLLEPYEHVVVFCDGDTDEGLLHAPFKLSGDGGRLVLVGTSPSGTPVLINSVDYGVQKQDVAWARSGCGGTWGEADPTPWEPESRYGARGDVDLTGELEVTDAVGILGFLFRNTAIDCPGAADTNADGDADVSDAVYLLLYLFGGAPAPLDSGLIACD